MNEQPPQPAPYRPVKRQIIVTLADDESDPQWCVVGEVGFDEAHRAALVVAHDALLLAMGRRE